MKTLFALLIGLQAFLALADELNIELLKAIGNDRTRWVAHSRSAEARECFRIVDSDGKPVTNANVRCAFKVRAGASGLRDVYGVTGTNGLCTITGTCRAYMDYSVEKDGYYCSHGKVDYMETTRVPAVADGKWQPYGETRTVVLKRIKNPYAVKVFSGEQCHRKIPAFEQWLPFDMEQSDWLAPYGKGVYGDVLLRFEKAGSGRVGDFAYSMEACFTNNPHAGFYCKPMDVFSDLKTDYNADTNAIFCVNYRFLIDAISNGPVKKMGIEKGSYLVFRTRTRVDENGRLIGAHYGKYSGSWRSDRKELHFGGGCFNPVENDNNIEGEQNLHYAIRNYKNMKKRKTDGK